MEHLAALGEALTLTTTSDDDAATSADNLPCCAICLGALDASANTAFIKPCLHPYCVGCILAWSSAWTTRKPDAPTPCPQCKQPFTSVYVQRTLDGIVSDHLVEESVVLLLRARWTNAAAGGAASQDDSDDGSAEFDEEDEEELLARQHRVRLIGNRKFGGGGFVQNGRLLARPLPLQPPPRAAAKKAATAEVAPAANSKQTPTPQRAKREAKAAQALAREAERRARRLGRLLPSAPSAAAGADEAAV